MKNIISQISVAVIAAILFSSCFSINNFQTAKTLDKGETELGAGIAAGSSFTIDADPEDTLGGFNNLGFPLADFILYGRYGITDHFDVGLRFSSTGDLGIDAKYMAVGDQESMFTLSPGIGVSTNSWLIGTTGIFQVEVPIHTSYMLAENFSLFLTPRYVGQTSTSILFEDVGWVNYIGGSAGMEIGRDIKFLLGINYVKALEYDYITNFNVGLGVRFRFGGDEN